MAGGQMRRMHASPAPKAEKEAIGAPSRPCTRSERSKVDAQVLLDDEAAVRKLARAIAGSLKSIPPVSPFTVLPAPSLDFRPS